VQWVPCRRVWGEGGREVAAVLVGRSDGDAAEGMGGVEGLMKGLRFAGREVREALERG
jgi:diphthine-ammonia ligase